MKYELIDHTADFGIRVFGRDLETLYENAAYALFDLITDIRRLGRNHTLHLTIEGEDKIDLMFNWLREILYLWNGREMLVAETSVQIVSETCFQADIRYDQYEKGRHEIRNEIKAVTWHQLDVKKASKGWTGEIIFDA
ncbi:MAG: archease [Desulfobacterales bacterium]